MWKVLLGRFSGRTLGLVNGAFVWVSGNHKGCQMGWLKVVSERVDTYFLVFGVVWSRGLCTYEFFCVEECRTRVALIFNMRFLLLSPPNMVPFHKEIVPGKDYCNQTTGKGADQASKGFRISLHSSP